MQERFDEMEGSINTRIGEMGIMLISNFEKEKESKRFNSELQTS
jgi:hypothetical protein